MLISLRGVAGYNVARQGFDDVTGVRVDPAIWSLRVELDLSWKLHAAPARVSSAGAVIPR